jgi:hypothetical protein
MGRFPEVGQRRLGAAGLFQVFKGGQFMLVEQVETFCFIKQCAAGARLEFFSCSLPVN